VWNNHHTNIIHLANLLFVCSKNQWLSPTAQMPFHNHPLHIARSAGTSGKARIKVNEKLLNWADIIFVMERRHKALLKERFPQAIASKEIIVLDIKDNYQFGDE
jgi:predicted protein tyrosine phosphatase